MTKLRKWRYVEDAGDSLCVYQCLSCGGRFNTDRLHDWLYCPRCGVRWEGEHPCRPQSIPRWVWDRFGSHPPWDLVWGKPTPAATAEWVIQRRTKWSPDEPWSDWGIDIDSPTIDVTDGSWTAVQSQLDMCRTRYAAGDDVRHEYRARIRRRVGSR